MKQLFYEDWTKKRIEKIINIFGKDWFQNKKILELGACHGDIGIELLKLGADVTFSDARPEHLEDLKTKLSALHFDPTTLIINQEEDYNLNKKFDLILHLGLLYNLENWQNDLKSALTHTNVMILESVVNADKNSNSKTHEAVKDYPYGPYNNKIMSIIRQEDIEQELTNLGCKFVRFDNNQLNSIGWIVKDLLMAHVYDWTYEKYASGMYNMDNGFTHFRRFWLVLK